jgi:hypothetical protein
MLLTIIQDPIEAALVGATFSLTLGLFCWFWFIFYYPYLNKFKHEYGTKEIIFLNIWMMHIKFYPIIVR